MGLRFPDVSVVIDHPHSLPSIVGAPDGRGRPVRITAKFAGGRSGIGSRLYAASTAICRWLDRLNARIGDSLVGDILGAITLFLGLYGLLLAVPVLEGVLK